ncbi:MAG: riboflavin synthase [Chitinophagales bacterium]
MFTGIIEAKGTVKDLVHEGSNLHITIQSNISSELKIDQSVAHNGVCLTVVKKEYNLHTVTAIAETLSKTNLHRLQVGNTINLERALRIGDRLDGHLVQGHVDTTAQLQKITPADGSWLLLFSFASQFKNLIVEKGSITINGISLTLVNVNTDTFSVAIIPYTWEHTNLQELKEGSMVNIEFDVVAKYIARMLSNYNPVN